MVFKADIDEFRHIDGSGNAPHDFGQAGDPFSRVSPSDYADGESEPAGADRPSARLISNTVAAQDDSVPNPFGASDMFWLWGQFVDHDIDLTREGNGESFNISVPTGDPFFDPFGTGTQEIGLTRTAAADGTGVDGIPREHVNDITAFLDGSAVYGSDAEREAFIRDEGGKLKLSEGDLLPFNTEGLPNAMGTSETFFLAGDVRANENAGLTSMHTLFVREHNRLVDELAAENPELSADELYQQAKAINEAQIQAITYNEFLPLLLGEDALPAWDGVDTSVDPQITNEFATAAYRVGHTMLSAEIERATETGAASKFGNLALRDAFFSPAILTNEGGIDEILRGLGIGQAETVDNLIIDDVRNFLFGPPGAGGFDLASLNIQRGRDQGLPDYNSMREAYGLERVDDFADITSDPALAQALEDLYGDVDNIDAWVGGLAEDPFQDAQVGKLFYAIMLDQFVNIRDADRFWYEGRFSEDEVEKINQTKLSDIIERNTDIDHMQDDVFLASDRTGGTVMRDVLNGDEGRDLMIGFGGNDRLNGHAGADDLFGDAGRDQLIGAAGDDNLDGGAGADLIWGGSGADVIVGGDDPDRLFGGSGADTFRYEALSQLGDSIFDFTPGEDVLDLTYLHEVTVTGFTLRGSDARTYVYAEIEEGPAQFVAKLHGVAPYALGADDILF